jgi:SAM-dependent methyltransferase
LPAARELRVLDVACGSADVSLALVGHARRDGVTLAVTGCDLSASAVERARARASATGIAADFVELNVLAPGTLEARFSDEFDVVMTSLFLHHLEADTAVQLLGAMRDIAGQLIVVDDLIRDRFGYVLAATAPRLLTRSPVVHTDARLSVRAAFTVQEASGLAEAARLADVDISRHWPARYLLTARGAGQ